eukprot:10339510-Ditylum_brightwellii.AAC.1
MAITPSTTSTVQMEFLIKKSVADEITCILPGIISTTLKELNIMKPITNNIDTSTSVTISTITGEGDTVTMPKENTAKDISDDNTNTTATSSQNSTSESSTNQGELDETEDFSTSTQEWKKSNALSKAALIQKRKSVHNAKKGVHFDVDLDDPGETIIQEQ